MRTIKLTMLGGVLLTSLAWGQDADPFDLGKKIREVKKVSPDAKGFTLTFEMFSVPLAKAAEMKRSKMSQGTTYAAVLKEVEAGKAMQDKLMEVRTVDDHTVTLEQVKEFTYPTEYEPPEVGTLPQKLPAGFKDFDKFITPATPSAFDTKKLGDTLELTMAIHPDDPNAFSGRITFTHIRLEGMVEWGEEESKVELPKFSVQKINSAVNLKVDQPLFIGALADPSEKPEREDHVWVAFATVYGEGVKEESGGE
jgi:hypothetical protein